MSVDDFIAWEKRTPAEQLDYCAEKLMALSMTMPAGDDKMTVMGAAMGMMLVAEEIK